ncbi:cobalt/nickel transport system permease protein [Roseateles sp. YR242]|nr:cobalt/nickel transport system permease protein [Roseateles sp. YR242]
MGAAWLASSPWVALGLAALMAAVTVGGARIPLRAYVRVARAPLGFLAMSCLSMLVSVTPVDGTLSWRLAPEMAPQVFMVAARALSLCTALLWLVLTTPLGDLLALMRQMRMPAVLLDLMVVAYRMQAVLAEAFSDGVTAQRARLGYGGRRQALRAMALLISQMAVQCWMRATALQAAADARNFDGQLRFLSADFPQWRRQCLTAGACGLTLMLVAALASPDHLDGLGLMAPSGGNGQALQATTANTSIAANAATAATVVANPGAAA